MLTTILLVNLSPNSRDRIVQDSSLWQRRNSTQNYQRDTPMQSPTQFNEQTFYTPTRKRSFQAAPAVARSGDLSPSTVRGTERSNLIGQPATERNNLSAPVATRSSLVEPSAHKNKERSNCANEVNADRSLGPTSTEAQSGLETPSKLQTLDMNNNALRTQNLSETVVKKVNGPSKNIGSMKESIMLNANRENEFSNIETGGFAAIRIFSGSRTDVWLEFVRYFENLMAFNN